MWSSRARVALAIALTTAAIAGCGGDDDAEGGTGTTGPATTVAEPGPSGTTTAASGTTTSGSGTTTAVTGTTTAAQTDGPRTTPVEAAGTPVEVSTARVVIPEGWTKNEQLATQTTAGQDPAAEASAWTKGSGAGGRPSLAIIVLAVPEKGAEQAATEQPDAYAKAVKGGFDRTSGLPASSSKVRPATTLGGRPAAKVDTDASRGLVRFLAAGRGDESYGITVIGQAKDRAVVERTLDQLQQTWSWTP